MFSLMTGWTGQHHSFRKDIQVLGWDLFSTVWKEIFEEKNKGKKCCSVPWRARNNFYHLFMSSVSPMNAWMRSWQVSPHVQDCHFKCCCFLYIYIFTGPQKFYSSCSLTDVGSREQLREAPLGDLWRNREDCSAVGEPETRCKPCGSSRPTSLSDITAFPGLPVGLCRSLPQLRCSLRSSSFSNEFFRLLASVLATQVAAKNVDRPLPSCGEKKHKDEWENPKAAAASVTASFLLPFEH